MSNQKPCSCIRDTFLLHVSSPQKNVVLIHDLSNWVVEDGFVYPDFYLLKIRHPNDAEETIKVSPKNGFIFNVDCPIDGVYEFTLDNCGVTYTQKELITSKIECSLDIALVKVQNDRDLELIKNIQDDLMVARAAAGIGNYESANKILDLAKQKLKNLSCDCECKK